MQGQNQFYEWLNTKLIKAEGKLVSQKCEANVNTPSDYESYRVLVGTLKIILNSETTLCMLLTTLIICKENTSPTFK